MFKELGTRGIAKAVRNKSVIIGTGIGLIVGAAGVSAGMAMIKGETPFSGGYDGAQLLKVADITPMKPPMGAPMSFASIIERVSPAVVSIETKGKVKLSAGDMPDLPGFDFNDRSNPKGGKDDEREVMGAGSGFLISADGYIVTNNHVVEGADEITVAFTNEKKLKAKVVGRDKGTDLAVIKVEGQNFPFVTFELNTKPRVGDWVIAVGNPFGLSGTATAGIISAFGRNDGGLGYVDYLQIDAPINRGNSGGPTFDLYGRVIGVNTAIITPSGGSAGIGFAIPADIANSITQKLIKGGKIDRGFIGVVIGPVSEDNAEALALKDTNGAFITDVNKDGPADKAGVQIGDIVKAVNGEPVKVSTDLTRKVGSVRAGDKVNLTVLRNGKTVQITVTAALRPSEDALAAGDITTDDSASVPESKLESPVLGLGVKSVTPAARKTLKIQDDVNGLVVTAVDPDSDAAKKGISAGDVVVRVDNRPVSSREEMSKIIDELKKAGRPSVLLLINHEGQGQRRNYPLPLSLK
jgi:serine protease Do